jgi:hypothetical protein
LKKFVIINVDFLAKEMAFQKQPNGFG